ncbi:MAG: glycosyltransferase family 2 protein [Chloroflexota bacterium]|nr:glycosyltransferase family 2 protein [Chloroflexota bacterium]
MRIGAGVFHYRYWPGVRETLDGLLAQTRKPDQILVFDHASGDGSADQIRAAYPELEVVEATVNRGPAVGESSVIKLLLERDIDAVMPVPHDLELAPDALQHLAARLEQDPAVGVAGPLIADPDERDKIFYAGGYVRRHNWSLNFREEPPKLSDWEGQPPQRVDFLQMGGALLRADTAREVGEAADEFYYWGDDVDYTLRVGAAGWHVECVPAAVGWQDFSDPPPYIATRNRLGLIARNAPKRFVARELIRQLYWLGRDGVSPPDGTRADLWPRFRGILDFCRNKWGPPPASLS